MELAARKQKILSAIVESFIRTGEPVGSKSLINETGLDVSSATVRNEMADLTNKGFLVQPHTSAGRVPTAQAYRYYVDSIMKVTPVSQSGREYIEATLYRSADSPESILQGASDLISQLTDLASVATTPDGEESRVHKISFVPIDTAVSIGYDPSRPELAQRSVVSTRYAVDGKPSGVLAVVGPVRMDYGRVISILESVADTVGTLIGELTDIHQ